MPISPAQKAVRWLAARVTKIVGNLLKILYYPFHFLFPKLRVTIPRRAKPIWPARKSVTRKIPKILWQTNYTDRVTVPVYMNYLFNRLMSPTFEHRFATTQDRADFINSECPPEVAAAYARLQIGAAQADLWRLAVLGKFGGVYLDIDAHLCWPLGFILPPDCYELYIRTRSAELTNYFIASAPGNPHLEEVLASVLDKIKEGTSKDVYEITGPKRLDILRVKYAVPHLSFKYTAYQGSFTNEYFCYVDHPMGIHGKWVRAQVKMSVLKP